MVKITILLLLLLLVLLTITATLAEEHKFVQSVGPAPKPRRQKLSHLRFYWHDIVSGRNPTSISVAQASTTNTSRTFFGLVNVIDDPLTEGPDMSSKLVGRAQGLYASAAQDTVGLIMAMNFAFMEGKYNGSAITILGRNTVFSHVREMSIIGGSGLFRLARGYAQVRTHTLDMKTGDAVVEYNVHIIHY